LFADHFESESADFGRHYSLSSSMVGLSADYCNLTFVVVAEDLDAVDFHLTKSDPHLQDCQFKIFDGIRKKFYKKKLSVLFHFKSKFNLLKKILYYNGYNIVLN